jgi:membrane protein
MAAAISYYVLFSIFPLMIFSAGILGLVLEDDQLNQDVLDAVMENVPLSEEEGRGEIAQALRDTARDRSRALSLLGLVGMAWSASSMFGSIRSSLNVVLEVEAPRPFLQQRLFDLAMVCALAPFFLGSVLATSFLRAAQRASMDVPLVSGVAAEFGDLWLAPSLALPFVSSFIAFLVVYWFVPARRLAWKDVWPGVAIAAFLFECSKLGFSFYVENFGNYDLIFGSLGAVVAFLLWIYVSGNVLLLGAEIASVTASIAAERTVAREPDQNTLRPTLKQRVLGFLRSLAVRG